MTGELLDTLVRLASLGASGISIFAIFWIGWLILRLPKDATRERHKTLRFFMVITVLIALIAGGTGFVNAKFNRDKIDELTTTMGLLQSEYDQYKEDAVAKIDGYKEEQIKTKIIAKSLGTVLESKEAQNLRRPSVEIQTHIDLLKEFLTEMGVATDPG